MRESDPVDGHGPLGIKVLEAPAPVYARWRHEKQRRRSLIQGLIRGKASKAMLGNFEEFKLKGSTK